MNRLRPHATFSQCIDALLSLVSLVLNVEGETGVVGVRRRVGGGGEVSVEGFVGD